MEFSSYFEATPPRRRKSLDEVPVLIFRPFGKAPKLFFKNVYVGEKSSKQLLLQNPQNEALEVELLKLPPLDAGVTFDSKKFLLSPLQEAALTIEWQPTKEGKFVYSIALKTNTNGRFNFCIICTSVHKKLSKKTSKMTVTKPSISRRVVLKSNNTHISSKQSSSIGQKSTANKGMHFTKIKPSVNENGIFPIVANFSKDLSEKENAKLTTVRKMESNQAMSEDTSAEQVEDVKNCSSETFIVSPESINPSVTRKELIEKNQCSIISNQSNLTTNKVNLFSSLTYSPIQSNLFQQPRLSTCRETFALSTPLSFISEAPEISPLGNFIPENKIACKKELGSMEEDSLSPLADELPEREEMRFVTFQEMESDFVSNFHSRFLDLNISPVKEIKTDISGIYELEDLTNGVNCHRNTFEVYRSSCTPLQKSKQGSLSSTFDSSLREIQDLKKQEFCFETSSISEFRTSNSDFLASQVTSAKGKRHFNYSRDLPVNSRICEDISFEPLMKELGNENNVFYQQTTNTTITKNPESNLEKKMKTGYSLQITPVKEKMEVYSNLVSFCETNKGEGNASECLVRQSEKNYLAFSPPHKVSKSKKENIPPEISTNSTSVPEQLLNENMTRSRNKDNWKPVSSQRKVKKEVKFALPNLVLASKKKTPKEKVLMNPEKILAEHANPAYCITATTINPFSNCAVFYDMRWFEEREKEFVRWLNVLLTPPAQLSSSDELLKVDVADLWRKSCKSDVAPAPSRETISALYLVNHRLDSLRRKSCAMFRLPGVAQILSKVVVQIEKGILSIRKDRNIIRDIVLKTTIIELLLCYNPLWLRIGLETIMGKTIPLESNSDTVGIVSFIMRNLLSDPHLVERYAYAGVTSMFKPGFEELMKKHILKKFFLLVFFLDYAKENKLIVHNPCLFCKNAQYKESRDLLLAFARDFLGGIGDITRHLRNLGYVVKHKQTYLDEYNYAVSHLGADLRDGVRLTKVTEIILQQSALTSCLRAPAISKLQKVHNVKVALTALNKAGHVIEGDITAKDIVEGHREKTMSLLWQIIYKFQLTRFNSAAIQIQNWYRSLFIRISRRIWIKKEIMRQRDIEDRASKIIQKYWRSFVAQQQYKRFISATYKIQKWYKSALLMKQERSEYLKKRRAVITIQRLFRRVYNVKQRAFLEEQKTAVCKISTWYYNLKLTRHYEYQYKKLKCSTIFIQRWYRSVCITKHLQSHFILKRKSALCVQRWYRNIKAVRAQKQHNLEKRNAAVVLQKWYRLKLLTKKIKITYLQQRNAVVTIQRWYRACVAMKNQRKEYMELYSAVSKIQMYFRAKKQLLSDMESFSKVRIAVKKIQLWFKSILLMRFERSCFLQIRISVVKIQTWYRTTKLMKEQQKMFHNQRQSAVIIQRKFRAVKLCYKQKQWYKQQRYATILIQSWYRSCIIARLQRQQYLKEKNAALTIQRFIRSMVLARIQRKHYDRKKRAVLIIQKWYRACVAMKKQRMHYVKLQTAVQNVQALFRNKKLTLMQRKQFLEKRVAARKIQAWLRSTMLMRQNRTYYLLLYQSTLKIQTWFRAIHSMRLQRNLYLKERSSALFIQRRFRALRLSHKLRNLYCLQKMSAIKIQRWFRSVVITRLQRQRYLEMRKELRIRQTIIQNKAAMKIQTWYKVNVIKRKQKMEISATAKQKEAVKKIEQWYHSILHHRNEVAMQIQFQREEEEETRNAFARKIQACWRGYYSRKVLTSKNYFTAASKKYVIEEKFSLRTKYMKACTTFQPVHTYSVILSASLLIECCVRLSREICEHFLLSSHLNTLITMIETMNRSLPAESVLTVLLKILMNILRHPQGIHRVLENEKFISVLAETTSKWCTKRTEAVFCHLCTVWWLIGQNQEVAEDLKKYKCVSVTLKKCCSLVSSWNATSKSSATPINHRLPDPSPYWCTQRSNRPKLFENGRFAIKEVMRKLNIEET